MILSFTLTMPNAGSWNGQWSGAGKLYVVTRNLGRSKDAIANAQAILSKGYFHYSFDDGWSAGITVKVVTPTEARKLKAASRGFCGYEWMVKSICENGKIEYPHPPIVVLARGAGTGA